MPTIVIYWSPGRTEQQKRAVAQKITDSMISEAGARQEDVLIIFQNIEPGDAFRGSALAPAVPKSKTDLPG